MCDHDVQRAIDVAQEKGLSTGHTQYTAHCIVMMYLEHNINNSSMHMH